MINELKIANNKKRAFTLVELMLVLVVLSLVIASSYSLITRKHNLIPRKAVHGQYACFTQKYSDGNYYKREVLMSGGNVVKDNYPVDNCSFIFPKTASYIYMQLIGGGGAGGNANYKIADGNIPLTYERSINLIEPDWGWREKKNYANELEPKSQNSGQNYITTIESWGGATTVSAMDDFPKVKISRNACTNCYEETETNKDTQATNLTALHNLEDTSAPTKRQGITRDYVDAHFTFIAKERKPHPVNQYAWKEETEKKTLFDSNLFQYIVRKYFINSIFAYDRGGGGPTAPGYDIKPLKKNEFSCNQIHNIPGGFAGCLHHLYKANLLRIRNTDTNGANPWCIVPNNEIRSGNTTLSETNINNINNNEGRYSELCPLVHLYYKRNAEEKERHCYGGSGGQGSYFTSVTKPFSYNFSPVLGQRGYKNYIPSEDTFFASPVYDENIYEDSDKKKIKAYVKDYIDFKNFADEDLNITISATQSVYDTKTQKDFTITENNPIGAGRISYNCTIKEPGTNNNVSNLSICFSELPTLVKKIDFVGDKDENGNNRVHEMKDWHYYVGGYPYFKSSWDKNGTPVGVGFIHENDDLTTRYDRTRMTTAVATACIAPGLMVLNNKHQRGNLATVQDNDMIFRSSYIPMPSYFQYTQQPNKVPDVNSPGCIPYENEPPVSCAHWHTSSLTEDGFNTKYLACGNGEQCQDSAQHTPPFEWLKQLLEDSNANIPDNWQGLENDVISEVKKNPWMIMDTQEWRNFYDFLDKFNIKYIPASLGIVVKQEYNDICRNAPLKLLFFNNKNEGIMAINTNTTPTEADSKNFLGRAVIPRAFGTPGLDPLGPDDLEDKTITDKSGNKIKIYKGAFYEDGTFYACPGTGGRGTNHSGDGNTGFNSRENIFVGRTGLIYKDDNAKNALNIPTGAQSPNNKLTLSDESQVGLKIRLNYYKHALTYGSPGQSGKYRTVFARAFSDSHVNVEIGNGGQPSAVDPGNKTTPGGSGGITSLIYSCQTGKHTCDNGCKCISASGGEGGTSGNFDEWEHSTIKQNPAFIREAISKLKNQTVIFPHCSLRAPQPTPVNQAKYTVNNKTIIDDTCYGNGGVEAGESDFAPYANLFDLSKINIDFDIKKIGKGGDGGFVRDDCWVVPQYFEIFGNVNFDVQQNAFDDDNEPATEGYSRLDNFQFKGDIDNNNNVNCNDNNFKNTIYCKLDGNRAQDNNVKKELKLAGYTRIPWEFVYGNDACRKRNNRYTGNTNTNIGTYYYQHEDSSEVSTVKFKAVVDDSTNVGGATEILGTEGYPGGVFVTW